MRIEDAEDEDEGENLRSGEGKEERVRDPIPILHDDQEEEEESFYIENNLEWSNALQSKENEDSEEKKGKKTEIIPGQGINEYIQMKHSAFNSDDYEEPEPLESNNKIMDWSGSKKEALSSSNQQIKMVPGNTISSEDSSHYDKSTMEEVRQKLQ